MLATLTVLGISFVLGSIPSAIWVGKLFKGVDVREHGSGNAGTTNTFRVLGWPSGVTVFTMDFMKGFVASFWISALAWDMFAGPLSPPNWEVDAFLKISCGLFAVIGHMFPLFAKFKGGKGAATACGMLFGIEPISIGISSIIFVTTILLTRYVSLASILASFFYPVSLIVMKYVYGFDKLVDGSMVIFGAFVATGIIVKHKSNIKRLLEGTESKVGASSKKKEQEAEEDPEQTKEEIEV
ncbi:acyl-phosphate glycerol 3-phosphate acyltransferase [Balneola sp. EhC07]|uniref:glycerol-3-phosphate 1-O-acyltransferase PlsY n=1 Tax=Balneola sp. EhC07 TaxID=1849360 RepID=UPI0007F4D467|nr:glycerol-3-phosphate 1-O-acyltransferase PlsY [Balneola sp. EhC07]OAN61773.1 acyl-phosphate glycerol 3-phosphate acyltransferase [Balneola sp. EhC07]